MFSLFGRKGLRKPAEGGVPVAPVKSLAPLAPLAPDPDDDESSDAPPLMMPRAGWAPTEPLPPPTCPGPLITEAALTRDAELRRLAALESHGEAVFQYVAKTAAQICQTPMALITLLTAPDNMPWVKASCGLPPGWRLLKASLCIYAVEKPDEVLVVTDTRDDARCADNPAVTEPPYVRFYAGAPLVSARGVALGTVSVLDVEPRDLTPLQRETLRLLAQHTAQLLEARAPEDGRPPH